MTSLQWGRRFSTAETSMILSAPPASRNLQWGRRFSTAETAKYRRAFIVNNGPSMGPPFLNGGNSAARNPALGKGCRALLRAPVSPGDPVLGFGHTLQTIRRTQPARPGCERCPESDRSPNRSRYPTRLFCCQSAATFPFSLHYLVALGGRKRPAAKTANPPGSPSTGSTEIDDMNPVFWEFHHLG